MLDGILAVILSGSGVVEGRLLVEEVVEAQAHAHCRDHRPLRTHRQQGGNIGGDIGQTVHVLGHAGILSDTGLIGQAHLCVELVAGGEIERTHLVIHAEDRRPAPTRLRAVQFPVLEQRANLLHARLKLGEILQAGDLNSLDIGRIMVADIVGPQACGNREMVVHAIADIDLPRINILLTDDVQIGIVEADRRTGEFVQEGGNNRDLTFDGADAGGEIGFAATTDNSEMGGGEEMLVKTPGNVEGRNHGCKAFPLVPSGGVLVLLRKGQRSIVGRHFPGLLRHLPIQGKVHAPVQETDTGGV